MKIYKARFLFQCLSPWVWINRRWKHIKQKNKKEKKKLHENTQLHLSISLHFVPTERLSCCSSAVESVFWHPIIFTCIISKTHGEKIASYSRQRKKVRYEIFKFICKVQARANFQSTSQKILTRERERNQLNWFTPSVFQLLDTN